MRSPKSLARGRSPAAHTNCLLGCPRALHFIFFFFLLIHLLMRKFRATIIIETLSFAVISICGVLFQRISCFSGVHLNLAEDLPSSHIVLHKYLSVVSIIAPRFSSLHLLKNTCFWLYLDVVRRFL